MVTLNADLLGTGSLRSGRCLDNHALLAGTQISRTPEQVQERTGISTRYWVGKEASAAKLAAEAAGKALAMAGVAAKDIKRLIFTNSTGGDFLIPATANAVQVEMGLSGTCDAFDLNNACMGFLTGFDLAVRSVATGMGPVCVVAVETLSRFISSANPRPYLVLADAAAAAVLADAGRGGRVLGVSMGNDGRYQGTVALAHPGLTGKDELIMFADSNRDLGNLALRALFGAADRALQDSGLSRSDIDWFVPHQPNGSLLARIVSEMEIPPDRLLPVVQDIGSVGAAALPMGLDGLMRTKPVSPGDRILMFGVGAGLSYGALVYEVGPGGI